MHEGPGRVPNWNSRTNSGKGLEARFFLATLLWFQSSSSPIDHLPPALSCSRAASNYPLDPEFTHSILPSTLGEGTGLEALRRAALADPFAAHAASLIPLYRLLGLRA